MTSYHCGKTHQVTCLRNARFGGPGNSGTEQGRAGGTGTNPRPAAMETRLTKRAAQDNTVLPFYDAREMMKLTGDDSTAATRLN
jgi:hypothetical protein